jgi:hypothetical protein
MTDELSPTARALLRAARSFDDPSADDSRRVRAGVLAKVGAAVGVGAALGATSSAWSFASIGAVLGTTAGKIGTAVVLVAGLSAGTYVATRPRVVSHASAVTSSFSSSAPIERPRAPMSKVIDLAPPSAPVAEAPSKTRSNAQPSMRGLHARRGSADLEGEVRLLEEADADLRRGDAEAALARLGEHASRYPSGTLADEREGVRAIALCRAGRIAEGRAAADRFLTAARKSSLATRVRTACNVEKSGD